MFGDDALDDKHKQWLVEFGARLRNERNKQKLTRIALSEKMDVTEDYIAQLERGNKSPSMRTFLNLISVLDISPDFLVTGSHDENEMDSVVNKFIRLVKCQDTEVASDLYEIVRFIVKYIKPSNTQ
jgi:transcriptional regulator with XRE-family HTH domain